MTPGFYLAGMKTQVPICIALGLSGCAQFAPPPDRDAIGDLSIPAKFEQVQSGQTRLQSDLLSLFNDKTTFEITNLALQNNLDIRAAALRMELAGYNAKITGSGLLPRLNGTAGSNRAGGSSPVTQTSSTSLDVSWEVDLWGKLQDSTQAARLDSEAAAEQLQFARASVAAQTMQAWFEFVRSKQAVQLENRRLDGLRRQEDLVRQNYRAGVGNIDDLSAIKRDVALSKEVLLANQSTQDDAARALELLLGQYPDGKLTQSAKLPVLQAPPKAGIPAVVLSERPDLRAAWQQVAAADRRIKVAQKELLPNIALTGSLGSQSSDLGDLLNGATIWSLAGNLTAPIFQGGCLKTEVLASRNRADQAWVSYLQAILRAFSEVERALGQETLLRQREAELRSAVKHAQTTANLFEDRYQAGLVSILELLNAQNAVFNIQAQLLSVRTARLNNRVALALALGKGV